MPQMANITVKKADGTTDVVYTALAPSSGDKTSAVWSPTLVGASNSHRPELRVSSQSNAANTVRFVDGIIRWPVVQTLNGVVTVTDRNSISIKASVAENTPDSDVSELVEQTTNLFRSALFCEILKTRYAAS